MRKTHQWTQEQAYLCEKRPDMHITEACSAMRFSTYTWPPQDALRQKYASEQMHADALEPCTQHTTRALRSERPQRIQDTEKPVIKLLDESKVCSDRITTIDSDTSRRWVLVNSEVAVHCRVANYAVRPTLPSESSDGPNKSPITPVTGKRSTAGSGEGTHRSQRTKPVQHCA